MDFPIGLHAEVLEVVVPSDYLSLIINGFFAVGGVFVGTWLAEKTRRKIEVKNEINFLMRELRYASAVIAVQENSVLRWTWQLCNIVDSQLHAAGYLPYDEILKGKALRPIVIEYYDTHSIYQLATVSPSLPIKFFSCIDSIHSINEAPKGGEMLRSLFVNHKNDLLCAQSCLLELGALRKELAAKGNKEITRRLSGLSWVKRQDDYCMAKYRKSEFYDEVLSSIERCVAAIDIAIEKTP
ncbi:hypothetical protein [Halodesulfovibrio spirochaetisodalis]|uniref:Uncharacterized protein n=1 Tax=Halodesulfovibrio spirochaetisodalis TaxID=1560234 RepID=A0A1B7XA69_9BACT|nr:hypothetical protein [Halodesulfovibrio spirochaetisodalis]OBQ46246.1 hypothetical protein SP90_13700 [Halodesulfovibrio spirochaetisodalis]